MENNLTITTEEKKDLLTSLKKQVLTGFLLAVLSIGLFHLDIFKFPEIDKNVTISILSIAILASLLSIKCSYTFYSKGLEKIKSLADKDVVISSYKRLNLIRQIIVWGCIIVNIILYYFLGDITFLMCSGMIAIVVLNMIPSIRKIDYELSLDNEEN